VISILGEGASPVKGSAHTMLSFILFLKGDVPAGRQFCHERIPNALCDRPY
jgi:hypothetical protein